MECCLQSLQLNFTLAEHATEPFRQGCHELPVCDMNKEEGQETIYMKAGRAGCTQPVFEYDP